MPGSDWNGLKPAGTTPVDPTVGAGGPVSKYHSQMNNFVPRCVPPLPRVILTPHIPTTLQTLLDWPREAWLRFRCPHRPLKWPSFRGNQKSWMGVCKTPGTLNIHSTKLTNIPDGLSGLRMAPGASLHISTCDPSSTPKLSTLVVISHEPRGLRPSQCILTSSQSCSTIFWSLRSCLINIRESHSVSESGKHHVSHIINTFNNDLSLANYRIRFLSAWRWIFI